MVMMESFLHICLYFQKMLYLWYYISVIFSFISCGERAGSKFIQLSTFQALLGQENGYITTNQCEMVNTFLLNLLV